MKKIVARILLMCSVALILAAAASVYVGAASSTDGDPVIMDFTDNSFVKYFNMTNLTATTRRTLCVANGVDWWVDPSQEQCGKFSYEKFLESDEKAALKVDLDLTTYGTRQLMVEFIPDKKITENHKYMRVTFGVESSVPAKLTMTNLADGDTYVISNNVSEHSGAWYTSNVIEISNTMVQRFREPKHVSIKFDSSDFTAKFYLKEVAFFTDKEAAYAHYPEFDSEQPKAAAITKMSFDESGNAFVRYGADADGKNWGTSVLNPDTGAIDITYATNTNRTNYMAKVRFNDAQSIDADQYYVRVLYAAYYPSSVLNVTLKIENDGGGGTVEDPSEVMLCKNIKNTNGEFVLTDTAQLSQNIINRLGGYNKITCNHTSLKFSQINNQKCTFSIKAIYFFSTKEAADAFTAPGASSTDITINGNPIKNYSIIIDEDAGYQITRAAERMQAQILSLSRVSVPILTDKDVPLPGEYEILLGESSHPLSYAYTDVEHDSNYARAYAICVDPDDGKTLIVSGSSPLAATYAYELFEDAFLFKGAIYPPEAIDFNPDNCNFTGTSGKLLPYSGWNTVTNTDNPEVLTESFAADSGIFTEDFYADDFVIGDGVMNADVEGSAITYIQTYEKNAEASADFVYDTAGDDGKFGLMLRYTGFEAYVRAGYDFENGKWFISFREGEDFNEIIRASIPYTLTAGEKYSVSFKVDGNNAYLSVNGTQILTANGIYHVTPGKPGIFAENVAVTVDNYTLTMLSGQGKVIRNVVHTNLATLGNGSSPSNGGTFLEMNDGSLNYNGGGFYFKSLDGGKTWESTSAWAASSQLIRLNDGRLLKIDIEMIDTINGVFYSYISKDEGASWTKGGAIHENTFNSDSGVTTTVYGGNQNDKLTQGPDKEDEYGNIIPGRLYYSLNYEDGEGVKFSDGVVRSVFCEFFYSDDLGETWHKYDTGSWQIEGAQDVYKFGECKLLECADGKVRVYSSWSDYGCIVYSELNDDGKTFGPLQTLYADEAETERFRCARSSMQFVRDPYGETDTTYYMVWVNAFDYDINTFKVYNPKTKSYDNRDDKPNNSANMPRAALSLAKSTDGKTWTYLGDIWRWESNYMINGAFLNHIVNPSVAVTENTIICATGLSEYAAREGDNNFHGAQRQHVWAIDRLTLEGEFAPFDLSDGEADVVKLTNFSRTIAKWDGYSMDTYANYKTSCDLNRDGKLNSIDLIIYTRHIAGWDGYDMLPFNTRTAN